MKIAVPSNRPGLDGQVSNRLGSAAYLVIVDSGDMSFERLDCPSGASGPGAGVAVLSLAVESGAGAVLVGHVAPHIAAALEKQGVVVATGVSGSVADAVADYLAAAEESGASGGTGTAEATPAALSGRWGEAAKKGLRQFYAMLPRLIGVILLLGLLQGFVSRETLFSLFAGVPFLDALWGGVLGSVMVGNPVNSYVIGESLLKAGVSLAGILALMMAWVTVGLIQLPVEAEALGKRFAVVRNLAGFIMAVLLSFAVGLWL